MSSSSRRYPCDILKVFDLPPNQDASHDLQRAQPKPSLSTIAFWGWVGGRSNPCLEDHPSGRKWLVTPIYKPNKGHLEGVPQPDP